MTNNVFIISGPTASGKSSLAIKLARELDGIIISADSMQIYRGMNIGTAKPSAAERTEIPHKLIDIVDIGERFSVSDFLECAKAEIDAAHTLGRLPIVVGGTGLYIDALINNTNFGEFECPPEIRASLQKKLEINGSECLHAALAKVDPESAMSIHPANSKRVIRALEVYIATGETLTHFKSISHETPSPYSFTHFTLVPENRDTLYDRINRRVDEMFLSGLEAEARLLYDSGLRDTVTASQAIAYKELFGVFRGEMTLEEATELLKRKTRNYAKRQLTWFSRYDSAIRLKIKA